MSCPSDSSLASPGQHAYPSGRTNPSDAMQGPLVVWRQLTPSKQSESRTRNTEGRAGTHRSPRCLDPSCSSDHEQLVFNSSQDRS